MALISTLVDPFNGASLNTGLWSQFTAGSATMTYSSAGASVNFPATSSSSTDGDITSVSSYDLTNNAAYYHVVSKLSGANNDCTFAIWMGGTNANSAQWQIENGVLYAQKIVASAQTNLANITFNPVTHAYLRIRENGAGTVIWSYSSDGVTYTDFANITNPWTITAAKVNLGGTSFGVDTSAGSFVFNNFNTLGGVTSHNLSLLGVGA